MDPMDVDEGVKSVMMVDVRSAVREEEGHGAASISTNAMTRTRVPGPLGQFQTCHVKPLVRFLTMPYLHAKRILQLSRTVNMFHMQSIYIARQAVHLVILLNDMVDMNEGPDDEQYQERIELGDELIELFDAMQEWGNSSNESSPVDYDRHLDSINQQHGRFFRERFYFHNVRNSSDDFIYGKLRAYDQKTIEFRKQNHSRTFGSIVPDLQHPITHEDDASHVFIESAPTSNRDFPSSTSLLEIFARSSRIHTRTPAASECRSPIQFSIPQKYVLLSDVCVMVTKLAACPEERLQKDTELVERAVENSPDDTSSFYPALKSLCLSSRSATRCSGYQLVKSICNSHSARLGHMEWGHIWGLLSQTKLDPDPLALKSQLDALETLIERLDTSFLLVVVFEHLLTWLPYGVDVGNFTLEALIKCDHLLMTIMRKNLALLGDLRFSELLERYCTSARCALQDSRFHELESLSTQPALTIEARATRLFNFLDHIQQYGFIPEPSFPILVRTICRLSFHFNVCITKTPATSPDAPFNTQAPNKRLLQAAKGLLDDRTFVTPVLERVLLPGRNYDWRFAVGAIFIARGLIWDTFSEEAPGALIQRELVYEEHREMTAHFDYWLPMLEIIPEKWSGKIHGDKVLVQLSDLVEEIILYCKYHQFSKMAVFVGKVISELAAALKRYRSELGLTHRFTLGEPHADPPPNTLIQKAERMLSLDMATTVMQPALVTLLVSMADHLCDNSLLQVIKYLLSSGRLEPTHPNWRSNLRNLLEFFSTRSQDYPQSREAIASYLSEFYRSVANLDMWHDEIYQDVIDVWERTLPSETSESILVAASEILSKEVILCHGIDTSISNRIRNLWREMALNNDTSPSRSVVAVKFLILAFNNFAFPSARHLKLLSLNATRSSLASMAITLFNDLTHLAGMNEEANLDVRRPNLSSQHARLVILQWLLRLRSSANHKIFTVKGPLVEIYPLAKLALRVGEESQAGSWSLASSLDVELFTGATHPSPTVSTFESYKHDKSMHWLPVSLYVSMLCDVLEYDHDWETVSLVICHLPLQFANHHFFCGPKVSPIIRRLAVTVCSAISQDRLFRQTSGIRPPQPDPADVKAVLYQTLTVLISYNWRIQESKDDEVGGKILMDVIGSFVEGLGVSVVTSKACLEALSLCVFTLPILGGFVSSIIERLSRVMTNPDLAIHILEFLSVLGQSGYREYRESLKSEDYQRLFGVALMYIDHHYRPDVLTLRTSDGRNSFSLTQHVLNMSFYVIHLWFTTLKTSERVLCIPLITSRLVASNGTGPLKPTIVVFLDWLARYTHGNAEPKVEISPLYRSIIYPQVAENREYNVGQDWETTYQNELKNVAKLKVWKLGASIITISSMKEPAGWLRIVNRRPSCTVQLVCRLEGHHQSSSSTIDPSLLTPFLMTEPNHPSRRLRRFQDPEALKMTLKLIDRIPVIDTHKVGVIYVAPGQSGEDEILGNQHGSSAYSRFLKQLGRVIKPDTDLEGYTAGLNPSHHGPYALAWWDDMCQILFHVASLMPASQREKNLHKKMEIGNDTVKIVWNEGGKPYRFDTIHSMYNFINLVIEPHTLMAEVAYQEKSHTNDFFKVLLQSHPSLPKILPFGEFKLVAAEALPRLMRQYSTTACMFCRAWLETGQDLGDKYPSVTNWESRLAMINKTERFLVDEKEDEEIMHGFSRLK